MNDQIVVMIGVALDLAILFALIHRKMWQTLPLFFIYAIWSLTCDGVFYYLLTKFPDTFAHYFAAQVVTDSLIQFFVLVELAWSILKPVRKSLPRYSPAVIVVIVAIAGIIIWPLAATTVAKGLPDQNHLISQLQGTFAILKVGFFLVMACFSQLLSIGWRDRELQIATGLGTYSIVSVLVALLHSHQTSADWAAGSNMYHYLDLAVSVSYVGTLSYWFFSFVTKEQERKEFSPQMQQLLVLMGGGARSGSIALTDLPSERSRKKD